MKQSAKLKPRGVVYWAVICPQNRPWPMGISPNRTCAIRRFLAMPINTPPGSGRAEMQRRLWAQKKRQGFRCIRVRITAENPAEGRPPHG